MHDLGQAEVPSIRPSYRAQQQMGVIGHDHGSVEVELVAVFFQAALKHNIPGFGRQFPAVVCGESDEVWPIVLLNVG